MPSAAPDYDELGQALAVSELSPSAAEAHGIYCGLLAAAAPEPLQRWLAELLPTDVADDAASAHCRALLEILAERTREQFADPASGLDLLLPDDERSLRERAVALHDWTRGFLFGLALSGLDTARMPAQAREAFDDLLEVTRMDLNDLDDDESNEQAFSDVVEFIRIASILLYEEAVMITDQPPAEPGDRKCCQ